MTSTELIEALPEAKRRVCDDHDRVLASCRYAERQYDRMMEDLERYGQG